MYDVLIVDDEKMIRNGIQKSIDWQSLSIQKVYTAASANEAEHIIQLFQPHIMLTDISMPEVTGLELIESIREKNQDMRIIVLTGYDVFDYVKKCLEMDVQNFLLKPVNRTELIENIKKQVQYLNEKKQEKEEEEMMLRARSAEMTLKYEKKLNDLIYKRINREQVEQDQMLQQQFGQYMERYLFKVAIIPPNAYRDDFFKIQTIKHICMSQIDREKLGISFLDESGIITIIFYHQGKERMHFEKATQLEQVLANEYDNVQKLLFGSSVRHLHDVNQSYNEAIEALMKIENGPHAYDDSILVSSDQWFIDQFETIKYQIVQNIPDLDCTLQEVRKLERLFNEEQLKTEQLKKYCFELISEVYYNHYLDNKGKLENDLDQMIRYITNANKDEMIEIVISYIKNLTLDNVKQDYNEIVFKAKQLIKDNLQKELTVTGIAKELYLSPNYFSRLFKKVEGVGCNEYIITKRIALAKELLTTTTLRTGKIAMMVGYPDTNYFSLAFKKMVGITPTEFRKVEKYEKSQAMDL